MLGDDDFYIFMIWNKSLVSNTKIYDMRKNILFENADVSVTYEPDEIDDFVDEAKKMVKTRTTQVINTPTYNSCYQYQQGAKYGGATGGPYNPLAGQTTTVVQGKKEDKPGKKDGKKGEKTKSKIGAGWQGLSSAQQSLYDDDTDTEEWLRMYKERYGLGD